MTTEMDRIRMKYASGEFPLLVRAVRIDGLRGFVDCKVELSFPIVAAVGENGAGKTTLLKVLACAYEQEGLGATTYMPGRFFMSTPWDVVRDVRLEYTLKHGKEERIVRVRKPTSRWRGLHGRPKRPVYLLDIARTMPVDALVGYAQLTKKKVKEASSETLPDELRDRLSSILGKTYLEARFARPDSDERKRVGVLRQDFGSYSKFHQGAGEYSALDLLGAIQGVPNNSLLLVDEVEASLHPKAQRRLIDSLAWLCRTKRLQIVLTTHSPYVLEALPQEARVLLVREQGGIRPLYGASPEFCLSAIDDRDHPELAVFVEDRVSGALTQELVGHCDADLLKRCLVIPVGPSNVVSTLGRLSASGALPYPSVAVQDADSRSPDCLVLPGTMAPEREVFSALSRGGWPDVSERFGRPPSEVQSILEDAIRLPDHHAWCGFVGDRLRKSTNVVWDTLAAVWVERCLSVGDREQFVEGIRDALAKPTQVR